MNFADFDAYIDSNASAILEQLNELCRLASIAAEQGPAMAETAQLVKKLAQDAGLTTEVVVQPSGPPIIIGRAGSGERHLMIYNHYDVQPPDPIDAWTSPPFQPVIKDGKLIARGVADNKADLLARLTAIRAYQETIGRLPVNILFVIEGEEEIGSPHLLHFVGNSSEVIQQVDGCLWEYGYKNSAGRPVVNLGVKGVVALELQVRTADSDAHSANGGLFPNAAWRLVEALQTLRSSDGRVIIDGLDGHIRPPSITELALIDHIPYDEAAVRKAFGLRHGYLGNLTGRAALRRLILEPACTINGLISGYSGPGSKTVIPSLARAKMDIRLVPDLTPKLTLELLRQHLDRRGFDDIVIIDCEDGLQPVRTSPDSLIARATIAALSDIGAGSPAVYPSSPGSGPMYEICGVHGIPVAASGVAWYGSLAHAPDENIRLSDFFEGIKVVGRLLKQFADQPT
jgi:acetylornithine deacetylase/succinyl-diaminopimelate desuccinylase-like protein